MKIGARYNHQDVRAALHAAQGATCCYCELTIRRKGTPIEHYRPKEKALRGRGKPTHAYDVIDARFPRALRAAWKIALPRP